MRERDLCFTPRALLPEGFYEGATAEENLEAFERLAAEVFELIRRRDLEPKNQGLAIAARDATQLKLETGALRWMLAKNPELGDAVAQAWRVAISGMMLLWFRDVERHAYGGLASIAGGAKGGARTNASRRGVHDKWGLRARELWAIQPDLSDTRVAQTIAREEFPAEWRKRWETIRKVLPRYRR